MSIPVNFQPLSPDNIDAAATYAIAVAQQQLQHLARLGLEPATASVLEFGPGTDFGPALILASMGAKATVADPFLCSWQKQYHPRLYRRIAELWDGPTTELLAAVKGGYEATSLRRVAEPAERLSLIESDSIDFTFSNAVFEHVSDFAAVAAEIARVTRPGGKGVHQIDLRDHRSFDRPLEHLAMTEQEFSLTAEDLHNEFGNRYRASEFEAHLNARGLAVLNLYRNDVVDGRYLTEFLPRLRRARSSYRNWPEQDLHAIGVMFVIEKPEPSMPDLMQKAAVTLEFIAQAKAAALLQAEHQAAEPIRYREVILPPQAIHGPDGQLWICSSEEIPEGDVDSRKQSSAVLMEDGRTLGPGHVAHDLIRAKGRGRYSHWRREVYFSTSDGTSPRDNGRRYSLRFMET